MAKERKISPEEEDDRAHNGTSSKRRHRSKGKFEDDSESDSGKEKKSRRSKRRRSRRKYSDDEDEDSYSSSGDDSSSDSYSDSESENSEHSSEERRERKKREEREKEKRRRRRREKEKRRKMKEKDEDRKKKKKKKTKKHKKDDKYKGKKGAVTNSWGKYGIIRETDMWNKRPEFTAWLLEVKQVNIESLPNWEEKQMFKQFMEDHNTATFPSKKYYDLDAYHRRKLEKEMIKGFKKVDSERIIFNDEEQRRLELQREREKQKEQEVEALKRSMQAGMAQAMKEQAQLREEMAYQYKVGNFEAAAAIQRRLDPDPPA